MTSPLPPLYYEPQQLIKFIQQVFIQAGMPESDALTVAESLVQAELEGSVSHGVSRTAIYAKRLREERISANPDICFERFGSILKVDGGNGLGQVVASKSIEEAIPIAEEQGIAGILIRNSNHFGTAAYYCQQACKANMALIAMTNSPPGIPPWGGKKAFFGTNPIAFGFPKRTAPPVIIDMSSSVVARGKIILADKVGDQIPLGWAMDEEGVETTDPAAALRGAVLPLGGAKGYALALAIEIITGILSSAAYGPHVGNMYKDGDPPANVGHSFILLNIAKWMSLEHYFAIMDQFVEEVKAVPKSKDTDEILIPGERRHHSYIRNSTQGLQLPHEVIQELKHLSEVTGIPFPKVGW